MPSTTGVLIECDPLIKAAIVDIDKRRNDIIVEDIDEEHLVIKENMVEYLKSQLDIVRAAMIFFHILFSTASYNVFICANPAALLLLPHRGLNKSRLARPKARLLTSTGRDHLPLEGMGKQGIRGIRAPCRQEG